MKDIIFIRHAKSSWEFPVDDRQRPIKSRGVKDIKLVSIEFAQTHFVPDAIFCSPAKRAKQTAVNFLKHSNFPEMKVQFQEELYDFSGSLVENFVKSLSDVYQTVFIFGHNFALTELSNRYGSSFIDNLPTSGLVHIQFDISSWKLLKIGTTKTILVPKSLR